MGQEVDFMPGVHIPVDEHVDDALDAPVLGGWHGDEGVSRQQDAHHDWGYRKDQVQ